MCITFIRIEFPKRMPTKLIIFKDDSLQSLFLAKVAALFHQNLLPLLYHTVGGKSSCSESHQKSLPVCPVLKYHSGITLFQEILSILRVITLFMDLLASKARKSQKTCHSIVESCHSDGASVSRVFAS